jgi:hypothetical protein
MESDAGVQATVMADSVIPPSVVTITATGELRPGRFVRYALAACLLSTAQGPRPPAWQQQAADLVQNFDVQAVPEDFPRLKLSVCAGPLTGIHGIQVALSTGSPGMTTWHSGAYGRPFGFWLVDGPTSAGLLDLTEWLEKRADETVSRIELVGLTYGFSHLGFPADTRSLAAIRQGAGEPIDFHPAFRGEDPAGGGTGWEINLTDPGPGTKVAVSIQIPGLWGDKNSE